VSKFLKLKNTGATKAKVFFIVTILCVISAGVFYGMSYVVPLLQSEPKKIVPAEEPVPEILYDKTVFEDIVITGKSFVVYDPIRKEIIASKDQDTVYPLASITKVMTSLLALQYIGIDEKIKILGSDLAPEGDSKLRIADVWSRDDLISYTLSVSSNDGARALARTAGIRLANTSTETGVQVKSFIEKMNSAAGDYGLTSFSFYNESGLDISTTVAGGYGNAADVAKLFAKAYFDAPTIFESTTESVSYISSADGNNRAENTNEGASNIPGLAVSKTGFTDSALGNLGVVVEIGPGRPVVIVVLHSSKDARFTDVEKLRRATVKAMK
jgi:D-alanyl-D-alanine carboxypeptidase